MNYRKDKRGTELSILGFGCMRLPGTLGVIDMEKTEQLIMEAYNQGVNYFDTAYLYPGSEAALGQILNKNNIRESVYIATKMPHPLCKKSTDFDTYFDTEKERLRTTYINYYLIHNITYLSQWEKLCELGVKEWLATKKECGEIHQIGFSFHGSQNDFGTLLDDYDWDFCQIQYNYINENYQAGTYGLHKAAEKNIPVIIMEPLLGGTLVNGLPKDAQNMLKQANSNYSSVEWALKWLWNQPEVTVVLSGMNAMSQLEENVRIASNSSVGCLPENELAVIDEVVKIFNASFKIPCTGCNYCMPCPQKINIPALFSAYNASYSLGLFQGFWQYSLSVALIAGTPIGGNNCIECGLCETHCPQQIPIRESLRLVEKRLNPFWFRAAFAVYRTVSRR